MNGIKQKKEAEGMTKKHNRTKRQTGFTLLEFLAAAAIFAVLVTMLFPTVNGYVKHAREVRAKAEAQAVCQALSLYLLDMEEENRRLESWELALNVCVPIEEEEDHVLKPYLDGTTKVNGTITSIYYNGTLESYEGILYTAGDCLVEAKLNGMTEILQKR